MAYIKSRKHGIARPATTAMGLALASLTGHAAEPATAVAAAESQTALPAVSVQAAPQRAADYKAEALSSPKFTQPLVDTPQTISVIKKEIVQERGATTLSEALASVPGITLQLGENGNTQTGDAIFMRGFDTSASIFVDGIRDLGFISRDTFNIEQIEVVKGASGSDFGRGASSGYVNLASKAPVGDTFTNASIAVGTADRKRLTADINRTLDIGLPGSALRLNLMAQDYGTPGRDYVRSNRWGFAPSLAFGLGTPTRTTLSYLHLEQNNRPDGGVPTYGISGYVGGSRGPAVDRTNYYGSLGDHDDVSLDMFTIRFEHDIRSGTTLRNITRLGRSEQDLLVTGVNGVTATAPNPANFTVQRVRQGRDQVNEILTNQTNLSTSFQTGFIAHTLSTGVEFIYERQKQKTPQTLNNTTLPASLQQPVANLYNPSVGDVFLTPPDKGAYTDGKTLTAAIYAFDNLKLSEQWQVNAGARVERYRTETNSASFTAQTSTAAESLTQNPQLATSDTLVSWKLAAVYKPAANGSVYAAVSTSYQPPGGNNFALSSSASSAAQPNLDPQKGTNIEIGTKWDLLGGRLATTAAIFRTDNENELVSDGGSPAVYTQVGKRRVEGVELGVVGQVSNVFSVSAGLTYQDSEIVRGVRQGTGPNEGGVIVFTPKVVFTSWATYKLPMGLTIGGGLQYTDTMARSSNLNVTSGLLEIKSAWIGNLMLAYDVTKNLTLQLNVNNVFNEEYMASLNNSGQRYTPYPERNALLTANFKF